MEEWMLQLDSARQTGLDSLLQVVLIVVESGQGGGFRILANQRRP
jgi:hypothetical protein